MTRARFMTCVLLVAACGGGGGATSPGASEPTRVTEATSDPCVATLDPQTTRDLMASAPAPANHEPGMQALEGFANEMCACPSRDTECVERVSDAMNVWAQGYAHQNADADRPMTPAEHERAATIAGRMGECLQRIVLLPST